MSKDADVGEIALYFSYCPFFATDLPLFVIPSVGEESAVLRTSRCGH